MVSRQMVEKGVGSDVSTLGASVERVPGCGFQGVSSMMGGERQEMERGRLWRILYFTNLQKRSRLLLKKI